MRRSAAAGLSGFLAANFQRHSPGGLNADGIDAYKKAITDFRTSFPDIEVVLDDSHYPKAVSFHLWTATGTNAGPGGTTPTGKGIQVSGASLMRYQDGKLSEELVYFRALDMQMQLGATSSQPASAAAPAKK
jgi:hypothetical protein